MQTNRCHSFGRCRDGQSKWCCYKELILYILSLVLTLLKKLLDLLCGSDDMVGHSQLDSELLILMRPHQKPF